MIYRWLSQVKLCAMRHAAGLVYAGVVTLRHMSLHISFTTVLAPLIHHAAFTLAVHSAADMAAAVASHFHLPLPLATAQPF